MSEGNSSIYRFEDFELDTHKRLLWRNGQPVQLPSKALDLLLTLIESQGRALTKQELMESLWTDQIVEEANLTVTMSTLRKALGEKAGEHRFIVTIPGRGYRFVPELKPGGALIVEQQTVSEIVIEHGPGVANKAPRTSILETKTPVAVKTTEMGWLNRSRSRAAVITVAAVLLGVTALGFYWWSKRGKLSESLTAASTPSIKSIAVLPFKPLVWDNRDESLEMGMADTLIAKLSNIKEVRIRPISSVRKYAGLDQDAVTAGREQKVDAVLDGQIQKSGEKIRVTVRLVRVADGAPIWSSQFDEKLTDIFAVQDSISARVAETIAARLTGDEQKQLTRHYTANAEAYQLYLKGRYQLNQLTDDGFRKSLEYFQQATEKDPNFALAYAGLAEAYNSLGDFDVRRPKDVYPQAKSAAMMALKLDDLLAEAHTALAVVKFAYDWDWSGAETEFQRAIEINPNDADAHQEYGFYLAFMGRFDKAVAHMKRAQELDPISLVRITALGQVLLLVHRYDEAIEQCKTAVEMDPNLGFAHWLLGLAYMQKGMYDPAILALQKSIPLSGDSPDERASLALAYARAGKPADARKILDQLKQLSRSKYLSPSLIASVHAAIGEKEEAFVWLDKAFDERDTILVTLGLDPMFDPLRSDPRFTALEQRVGLAQ